MSSAGKICCAVCCAVIVLTVVVVGTLIGLAVSGYVWKEYDATIGNKDYVFLYTSLGVPMAKASQMCKDRKMILFEPRDATANAKVYDNFEKHDIETYWINIKRPDATKQDWKYLSDDTAVSWFNWRSDEPDNFMNLGENCAMANLQWILDFEDGWSDVGCEHWNQVICQDGPDTPAADVVFEQDGKSYTLMPSKSGNFEEVKAICEDQGLMMFEPRNEATYDAVYAKAKEHGLDMIYMNIQRENPESKFKFLSDNTEIDWDYWAPSEPNNYGGNGENCVSSHFLRANKGQWIDIMCEYVGQVICQET